MNYKHLAAVILICIVTLVPAEIFAAGTGVFFDEDIVYADNYDDLKAFLEDPSVKNICLSKNINADNKKDVLDGLKISNVRIIVSGEKNLDLNGKKIKFNDYKDYNYYVDYDPSDLSISVSEAFFISIPKECKLSIYDSKNRGAVIYDGFYVNGQTEYYDYLRRNLFTVEGSLNVYGGYYIAGGSKKRLISAADMTLSNNSSKNSLKVLNQVVLGTCVSLFDEASFKSEGGYFSSNGIGNDWPESCIYAGINTNCLIKDGEYKACFGSDIFSGYTDKIQIVSGSFIIANNNNIQIRDINSDNKLIHGYTDISDFGNINFTSDNIKNIEHVDLYCGNKKIDKTDINTCVNRISIVPNNHKTSLLNEDLSASDVVYNGDADQYLILKESDGLFNEGADSEYRLEKYDNNGSWSVLSDWAPILCSKEKVLLSDLYDDWQDKCRYRVAIRTSERRRDYNNEYDTVRQSNYLSILYGYDVILTKGECQHEWSEIEDTATCISDGVKIYQCTLCGESKTEISKANGKHAADNTYSKDAYHCCKSCIYCGKVLEDHSHYYTYYYSESLYNVNKNISRCIYCGDIHIDTVRNSFNINDNALCVHGDTLTKEELNDTVKFAVLSEVGSDCVNNGRISLRMCRDCGKLYTITGSIISESDIYTLPLSSHSFSDACDNTCNVCGSLRYVYHYYPEKYTYSNNIHFHTCSYCGKTVDAQPHSFEYVEDKLPTCEEEGYAHLICKCGYKIELVIPPKGHQLMYIPEMHSDCVSAEYDQYYKCLSCNKMFSDKDAVNIISVEDILVGSIRPDIHIGGQIFNDEKYHWEECLCGEILNKNRHKFENGICVWCGYKK